MLRSSAQVGGRRVMVARKRGVDCERNTRVVEVFLGVENESRMCRDVNNSSRYVVEVYYVGCAYGFYYDSDTV